MLLVADASALIALATCDGLSWLDALFGEVLVPEAVYREVTLADKPQAMRQIPPFALRISYFVDGLTDDLSTAMVKRIQNRYDVEIWPWELRQMAARRTPDNTRS